MTEDEINKRLARLLSNGDTNVEKLIAGSEKRLVGAYKTALADIKKEIAWIFEKYGNDVSYADMMRYNRLQNLQNEIANQVKTLANQNIKTVGDGLTNFFSESYYRSAFGLEVSLGAKLGFGLLDPKVIRASIINPADRINWNAYPDIIKNNAQKYAGQIINEVSTGLIKGSGYAKIAAAVTDKTGIDANRSLRIIRTEGHRAQSAGRILAFDKSEAAANRLGVAMAKTWVATLDNRTRADHRYMDKKEADPETGLFKFKSGATTQGPGLSGIADEDINCRCTMTNKIKMFSDGLRKDNITKAVIPNMSYQEWYSTRIAS